MTTSSRRSGAVRAEAGVVNLGARGRMATGICFLDHMVDQFTSHAQLGVTVRVAVNDAAEPPAWLSPHADYAGNFLSDRPHDRDIFAASGAAVGAALRVVVDEARAARGDGDGDGDGNGDGGSGKRAAAGSVADAESKTPDRDGSGGGGDGSSGNSDGRSAPPSKRQCVPSSSAASSSASASSASASTSSAFAFAAAFAASASASSAVFCCPLDEALTEVTLDLSPPGGERSFALDLAPYGTMPRCGRRWIGAYRCELTTVFWEGLAAELGASMTLRKVRGDNAHHIVESTFKAFARAFRACLDSIEDGGRHGCVVPAEDRLAARRRAHGRCTAAAAAAAAATAAATTPSVGTAAGTSVTTTVAAASTAATAATTTTTATAGSSSSARSASRTRATKETSITVRVDLDARPPTLEEEAEGSTRTASGGSGGLLGSSVADISTGVLLMDRILAELRRSCGFMITVECAGDVYIDDHHTAEDVAITLGQCINEALGDKAGLARMACAEASSDDGATQVRAVLDLSNRPHFDCDLNLDEEFVGGDEAAAASVPSDGGPGHAVCGRALSCEMLHHVFDSLTLEARATAHVEMQRDSGRPGHTLGLAVAMARAYGAALAECVRVDPRRAGKVASSKGTLSL